MSIKDFVAWRGYMHSCYKGFMGWKAIFMHLSRACSKMTVNSVRNVSVTL